MRIEVINLPPDVTEEEIVSLFHGTCEIDDVALLYDGNPNKVVAWVRVESPRVCANALASKISGELCHGRKVGTYVSLFFDD